MSPSSTASAIALWSVPMRCHGNVSRTELTDLHMIVLSWLNHHPGHAPEDIAKGLRADVDEIGTASSQTTWHPH